MTSKLLLCILFISSTIIAGKVQIQPNRISRYTNPLTIKGIGANSLLVSIHFEDAQKNKLILSEDVRRNSLTKGKIYLSGKDLQKSENFLSLNELRSLEKRFETWLKESKQKDEQTTSWIKEWLKKTQTQIKQNEAK